MIPVNHLPEGLKLRTHDISGGQHQIRPVTCIKSSCEREYFIDILSQARSLWTAT